MNIEHQKDQQRFIATLADSDAEAKITYRLLDEQRIDFDHTFVPPEFRGKGVAGKLLDAAVEWAQQEGYTLNASCSYARVKLQRMKLL